MKNEVNLLSEPEEVIEILSSSPPRPPKSPKTPQKRPLYSFSSSPLFEHEFKAQKKDEFEPIRKTESAYTLTTPLDPVTVAENAEKPATDKRPIFKAKKSASAPVPASKRTSIAVPAATNRTKTSHSLQCTIKEQEGGRWCELVEAELQQLESQAKCTSIPTEVLSGVSFVVTVLGEYTDEWDDEQQAFVKCSNAHTERLPEVFIGLNPEQLDELGKLSFSEQKRYFDQVLQQYVCHEGQKPIFIVPEVAGHFKKQIDKFNRELRRRVADDGNSRLGDSTEVLKAPPNEQFYTTIQTELQVLHELRIYYPRKCQEAAEIVANCIIDMGFTRYRSQLDECVSVGGNIRNKSDKQDISTEVLTKIPGLPPRIATKLAAEAGTIGMLRSYLGENQAMRASRIKRFGKGTWNDSLLTFLHDMDPQQTI